MRLLKCHIENFGKLHDFTLNLDESPVVIDENNGWGKSTFASFIKVMFFGFANEKKRGDAMDRERLYFKPWQGGVYGGELEFETDGRRYLLNRTFGSRETDDTFALYDAATNLRSEDFTTNIGEELFQINQESFLRTVYIAQNDCVTGTTDSINAKIGNLADNLDDINNYEKVQQVLKDMKNNLSPKRKTGELKKLEAEIDELKNSLRKKEQVEKSVTELQNRLEQCRLEKEEAQAMQKALQEELLALGRQRETEAKRVHYGQLLHQCEERQNAVEACERAFGGRVPGYEELRAAMDAENAAIRHKSELQANILSAGEQTELERNAAMFAAGVTDDELLAQRERSDRSGIGNVMVFILSAVLVPVGAFFCFLSAGDGDPLRAEVELYSGVALAAVGLVVMLVLLCLRSVFRVSKKEMLTLQMRQLENDRSAYLRLAEKQEKYRLAKGKFEREQEFLADFFRKYGQSGVQDADAVLRQMAQKLAGYEKDIEELEKCRRECREFEQNNDISLWEEFKAGETNEAQRGRGMDEVREELQKTGERMEADAESRNAYLARLDECQLELEQLEASAERLAELEERYGRQYQYYRNLELTSEYLARAKESFSAKYMGPIMNSFRRYFESLSRISGEDFRIDANICITKKEAGEQRDTRAFSAGSRDLIAIALRMALIEAMYQKERPFLIFDDPFVNLDSEKLGYARQFLREIAQRYQVIYFTCHESRA